MTALSPERFPILGPWPPQHPDRLQYYGLPTPNGVKVSIMLEEVGLPYEAHRVDIGAGDQRRPEFLALNPNGKIPAILDPDGPGGEPLALWESGAILLYLADKTGQLLPPDPACRQRAVQWLMFQMGSVGPMFGQLGYFHKFDGRAIEDPRPKARYVQEAKRLLGVLEGQLATSAFLAGDAYSIADIATLGWVRNLIGFYGAGELVDYAALTHVPRWLADCLARDAVQRGLQVAA